VRCAPPSRVPGASFTGGFFIFYSNRSASHCQYTTSPINDKRILIDAGEFGWIKEHGSLDNFGLTLSPRPKERTPFCITQMLCSMALSSLRSFIALREQQRTAIPRGTEAPFYFHYSGGRASIRFHCDPREAG
jgi:hypothetical protein